MRCICRLPLIGLLKRQVENILMSLIYLMSASLEQAPPLENPKLNERPGLSLE